MTVKATIAVTLVRLFAGSLRYRFVLDDPCVAPQRMNSPAIYVFWHEMLLLPLYTHCSQILPLVSRGRDGAVIDEVIRRLGGRTIRGSTDHDGKNRGGRTALREMLRAGCHIGVAIDGPVGPRRETISPGVAFVAGNAGMPIIPVGIAMKTLVSVGRHGRAVNLPRFFSNAWYVLGSPLAVPPQTERPDLRALMQRVKTAMDDVQARAEEYARTGQPPTAALTLRQFRDL